MPTKAEPQFADLVEQYLGQKLPEELATSFRLSKLPAETQNFIVRMLTLMKQSEFSVTNFTPHLIHWISVTVPGTLPGAWGGRIPPLTLPGRHRKLDAYAANCLRARTAEKRLFVDIGCGFPPVTSVDTAGSLTDWQVYGVDRLFADYVLYDSDGHYACFDQSGAFLYFQALMNAGGRALYADPGATRDRFNALFRQLQPQLREAGATQSESVSKDGHRLVRHHIRDFETTNLAFIQSDLRDLDLPPATVIRCMNILTYYEPEIRAQLLAKAFELLDEDGICMAGTNGLGIQTRYAVYRKNSRALQMDEFAFGLDNAGHIVFMPFFSIHADDPEALLLAELTGTLRTDPSFGPAFAQRQDELLQRHGICKRNGNGFFDFFNAAMSPGDYLKINALIWRRLEQEGYTDQAVRVLQQAGYDAWKNSVNDIAIRPASDAMSTLLS